MANRFTKAMANYMYANKRNLRFFPSRGGYRGHWHSSYEMDLIYEYVNKNLTKETDYMLVEDLLLDAYNLTREGMYDEARKLVCDAYNLDKCIRYHELEVWEAEQGINQEAVA